MIAEKRRETLERRHRELQSALDAETHRPFPDDAAIQTLKKQKLRLKDSIAQSADGLE